MLKKIESEIEKIISKSQIPEDPIHSKNTREWILKLKPEADISLQIAALGHDIERSIDERKIRREDYTDYNDFKKEHSKNSARILQKILFISHIKQTIIDEVTDLVILHEFGGNPEADILKNADSISFFDVSLPFYFQRNSEKETVFRILWGYKRLSKYSRSIVRKFRYDNPKLEELFRKNILKIKY